MIERNPSLRPSGADPVSLGARASVVNRTHRIVRAQAQAMREQRSQRRSLWVPLAICSTLLLVGCYAGYALLDFYDVNSDGVIDSSDQLFIFLLWMVPIVAIMLGFTWMRRSRRGNGFGEVSS